MKILVLALMLFVARVSAQTVDVFPKGCVIAAVEYQANLSLKNHRIWSRIIKINFDNQQDGHAVVVFSLPAGALCVYDLNLGTRKLGISQRDLPSITIALKYQYEHVTTAVFFD